MLNSLLPGLQEVGQESNPESKRVGIIGGYDLSTRSCAVSDVRVIALKAIGVSVEPMRLGRGRRHDRSGRLSETLLLFPQKVYAAAVAT